MKPAAAPPIGPQQQNQPAPAAQTASPEAAPACAAARREEEICPVCAATMRLWAGFYRCGQCGFKESCCF